MILSVSCLDHHAFALSAFLTYQHHGIPFHIPYTVPGNRETQEFIDKHVEVI